MFILLAGGGKVGYYLLKALLGSDQEVILIEKASKKCDLINEDLGTVCVCGDACDPAVLEKAGVERADMIVAITGEDEDNLVICQVAKKKFQVPFSIARVNNPKNEEIFKELGIDATVSSTNIILSMIEDQISYKGVMTALAIQMGGVKVVETLITVGSPAVNKSLRELGLPSDCTVALVIRENKMVIPDGSTILREGDLVITLIREFRFSDLKRVLVGEESVRYA